MRFKMFIREYFHFSSGERRGVVVLMLLLVVTFLFGIILRSENRKPPAMFAQECARMDSIIECIEQQKEYARRAQIVKAMSDDLPDSVEVEYMPSVLTSDDAKYRGHNYFRFAFDPNILSKSGWDSLGVPLRVIRTLKNYLKAGGRFYKAQDLSRIYGFPDSLVVSLSPYVKIHSKLPSFNRNNVPVQLNSADTSQLKQLPYIGPVLALRIVKYRRLLGGFSGVNQLAEVYGLSDQAFDVVRKMVAVDSSGLSRIDLNRSNVYQLQKHPYIGLKQAKDIVGYRNREGDFSNVTDLLRYKILEPKVFERVKLYLEVK